MFTVALLLVGALESNAPVDWSLEHIEASARFRECGPGFGQSDSIRPSADECRAEQTEHAAYEAKARLAQRSR